MKSITRLIEKVYYLVPTLTQSYLDFQLLAISILTFIQKIKRDFRNCRVEGFQEDREEVMAFFYKRCKLLSSSEEKPYVFSRKN